MVASSAAWSNHLTVVAETVGFSIEPSVYEIDKMFAAIRATETTRMPGGCIAVVRRVGEAMLWPNPDTKLPKSDLL